MSDEETQHTQTEDSSSSDYIPQQTQNDERERVQRIIDQMTPEELHRYESFRRAAFSRNTIKKLCSTILQQSCNTNFSIAVAGIAKVFTGELVEAALSVQAEWKDSGPLLPSHIHEAYRRLHKTMPNLKMRNKNVFWQTEFNTDR